MPLQQFVLIAAFVVCVDSNCFEVFGGHAKWIAKNVDNGEELKKAIFLKENNPDIGVIVKLQVINGTNWLNLGGDVHTFGLVVGTPPSTSSDLTLKNALQTLEEKKNIGALLEFNSPGLKDLANLEQEKGVPLWTFTSVDSPDTPDISTTVLPAFKWSQKRYGLDKVLARVAAENLLLHFDFERTKEILDTFYSYGRKPLTENSITYLKRKYQTVQRQHPSTFTEVYLNNLLHLVESDSKDSKSASASFLKDLQDLDEAYSQDDVKLLEEKLNLIPAHNCALVQVRAGIFLQNESTENLVGLVNKYQDRIRLLVTSLEHDQVQVKPLMTAIDRIGKGKLILDFPETLSEEMKLVSHIPNHTKELVVSSNGSWQKFSTILWTCITILYFVVA